MSECACDGCQRYCRLMPGALTSVADLERLEALTRKPGESENEWISRMLVASAGAVIGTSNGHRLEVPTLALRSTGAGACVHLDSESGRCEIYEARPSGCSEFDDHQTGDEGNAIGLPMHRERAEAFAEGSRYSRLWIKLHDAGVCRSRENLNRRRALLTLAIIAEGGA